MRRILQAIAAVAVAGGCLVQSAERAGADTSTEHARSPTGTWLVSWPNSGTVLTFFNVETGVVTGAYNAGFDIYDVRFSISERYVCVEKASRATPRVVVIDRANQNHKVIDILGGPATYVSCGPEINPKGPLDHYARSAADSRANRLVPIVTVKSVRVQCGEDQVFNETYITEYWDPKGTPRVIRQFSANRPHCVD